MRAAFSVEAIEVRTQCMKNKAKHSPKNLKKSFHVFKNRIMAADSYAKGK